MRISKPALLKKSGGVLLAALLGLTGALFSGQESQASSVPGKEVVLRALDKVTARTEDLTIPIGQSVYYGTLQITARKCLKRPPEETPETSTFLEILDNKQDEDPVLVFMGWMFASSPALSALEHPVYDVWVIDCKI
ncbi:DUF2155 domain-containing protein [Sneathiella chinensis]|uniref:DUF2155 domain-containing protein n=1 Tax=Sneathiella chinensis TaxID=349750 RepID=UPI0019D29D7E|nr:DUF2155 domain-containing protein [Sneathiella chinensis]